MNNPASNQGWFKAIRSDDAMDLIRRNRNAFILLYVIACRARWREGIGISGLSGGQAFVGDHDAFGLSEREYRTAKSLLEKCGFATFKPTTKGTVATLCATSVFDITGERDDEQSDGQPTDSRRTSDGQATTKEEGKKGRSPSPYRAREERCCGVRIPKADTELLLQFLPPEPHREASMVHGWKANRLASPTGKLVGQRPSRIRSQAAQGTSRVSTIRCSPRGKQSG